MSPTEGPGQEFRFRVKWNGRCAAGFDEVSPLPVNLKHSRRREGGGPPPATGPEGQGTPFFINLERGVAFDLSFEQWISMVRCYGPATGKGSLLPEYKRSLAIQTCNDDGGPGITWRLFSCWVTEYRAIPAPGADSREVMIEHLRLGFDRWERDPPEEEVRKGCP